MRLLVIGFDADLLDPSSASAQRQRIYYDGFDVDILLLNRGPFGRVDIGSRIHVLRSGGTSRAGALARSIRGLFTLIRQKKFDVVSTQDPFVAGALGLIVARLAGARLQVQEHGDFFSAEWAKESWTHRVLVRIGRCVLRRADGVRVVSERVKQHLLSMDVREDRITVLPVVQDLEKLLQRPMQPLHAPVRLVVPCRFVQQKGLDVLLESVVLLRDSGTPFTLKIIGRGPLQAWLESRIAALGLKKNVIIHSWMPSDALWDDADIFLMTSRYEGWGRTIIEAMAAGVSVVTTDVGCAGTVVRSGVSGYVVPVGDPEAIARSVVELIQRPSHRDTLRSAAREVVKELPSIDTQGSHIRSALERICPSMRKPRLLVITQRIDEKDANLAFHVRWIAEIASRADFVTVIAQCVGTYELPKNVRVISLGKEKGASKCSQLIRLQSNIFRALSSHDAVLVLMIPLYAYIAGIQAIFFRKSVYLWYAHKSVSLSLRVANIFVKQIFTASAESMRLHTNKKMVIGHAIETNMFKPDKNAERKPFSIVTVGRITKSKHIDTIIHAVHSLRSEGLPVTLQVIGEPIMPSDEGYLVKLRQLVVEMDLADAVCFVGGRGTRDVARAYSTAAVCVNASSTGSMDKAVLEAMSSGCPVVTSNEAFHNIVPSECFVPSDDVATLAKAIRRQVEHPSSADVLRKVIVEKHDLTHTIGAMVDIMSVRMRKTHV